MYGSAPVATTTRSGRSRQDVAGRRLGAVADVDRGEPSAQDLEQPLGDLGVPRRREREPHLAARPLGALEDHDPVPARGGRCGGGAPGRPAPTTTTVPGVSAGAGTGRLRSYPAHGFTVQAIGTPAW